MRLLTITTLILAASWLASVNASEVYRWTDENGVTQYSDTPPANAQYNRVKVRTGQSSSSEAHAGNDVDNTPEPAPEIDADAIRAQRCQVATKNLETLRTGMASMQGEDGQARPLEGDQLQQQIDENQRIVNSDC